MSAETMVFSALSSHAPLVALVSNRVYPDVLPEKAIYPAVVFSRERTDPIYSISNDYFGADVGLQIQCWGKTRTEADAVAVAVSDALVVAGIVPSGRSSGYDQETDLFASLIDIEVSEP